MGNSNIIDVNEGNIQEAYNRLNSVIKRAKRLEQNISFRAKTQNYKNVNRIFNNSNNFIWKLEKNKSYLYTMLQYINNIDNSLIYYYSWGTNSIEAMFTFDNVISFIGKLGDIEGIKIGKITGVGLKVITAGVKGAKDLFTQDYGEISGVCKAGKAVISVASAVCKYADKDTAKTTIKGVSKTFIGRFKGKLKESFKSLKWSKASNVAKKVGVVAQWADIALSGVINWEKNKKEYRWFF